MNPLNTLDFTIVTPDVMQNHFDNYKRTIVELNDKLVADNICTYDQLFRMVAQVEDELSTSMIITDMDVLDPRVTIRNKCLEISKEKSSFDIDQSMRRDVFALYDKYYSTIYPSERSSLNEEERAYVEKVMTSYLMLGLQLPEEQYQQAKAYMKECEEDGLNYKKNISENNTSFELSKDELEGMPEDWLASRFNEEKQKYIVTLTYPDLMPIMDYCKVRSTRKLIRTAYMSTNNSANLPVIAHTFDTRMKLAKVFGFSSFSDYTLQQQMAKDSTTVLNFLNNLVILVKPLVKSDMALLTDLARSDGIDKLDYYDTPYYTRIYKELNTCLNMQDLKKMFSIESVTNGIFKIYQQLLGLSFTNVSSNYPNALYHENVTLYAVHDATMEDIFTWICFHAMENINMQQCLHSHQNLST
jgi:saccharolysin